MSNRTDATLQMSFDDLPMPAVAPERVTFPEPNARHDDIETSHEAASDASFNASYGRLLVLKTLAAHPLGLTDFELAAITGWQQTSIGKRRGECVVAGLVEPAFTNEGTGGPVLIKRKTPSGSKAAVWVLTLKGRDYLRSLEH